jgi:membrane protein YqaA with SNARE-associated domain
MWAGAGLGGLFLAAFLAATPILFQSEVMFIAAQAAALAPLWLLIVVASVGNTLGSCVTFIIGRQITRWQDKSWFPVTPDQLARASGWFNRWGAWSLLLSWAPFGDIRSDCQHCQDRPLSCVGRSGWLANWLMPWWRP